MAHYRRRSSKSSFMLGIMLLAIIWTYRAWAIYTLHAISAVLGIWIITRMVRWCLMRRHNATLEEIDVMDGLDFELYVARLLEKQGFKRVSLTERYDMGVDIVAEKDGERWGVQVKRYNGLVKAAAIRQVVTALNFYGCQRAMVITNSTYSNVACRLATSNGCILINRNELIRWMR